MNFESEEDMQRLLSNRKMFVCSTNVFLTNNSSFAKFLERNVFKLTSSVCSWPHQSMFGRVTLKDDLILDQWSNKACLCYMSKDRSEVWQHSIIQSENEAA